MGLFKHAAVRFKGENKNYIVDVADVKIKNKNSKILCEFEPKSENDFDVNRNYYVKWQDCKKDCGKDHKHYDFYKANILCLGLTEESVSNKLNSQRIRYSNSKYLSESTSETVSEDEPSDSEERSDESSSPELKLRKRIKQDVIQQQKEKVLEKYKQQTMLTKRKSLNDFDVNNNSTFNEPKIVKVEIVNSSVDTSKYKKILNQTDQVQTVVDIHRIPQSPSTEDPHLIEDVPQLSENSDCTHKKSEEGNLRQSTNEHFDFIESVSKLTRSPHFKHKKFKEFTPMENPVLIQSEHDSKLTESSQFIHKKSKEFTPLENPDLIESDHEEEITGYRSEEDSDFEQNIDEVIKRGSKLQNTQQKQPRDDNVIPRRVINNLQSIHQAHNVRFMNENVNITPRSSAVTDVHTLRKQNLNMSQAESTVHLGLGITVDTDVWEYVLSRKKKSIFLRNAAELIWKPYHLLNRCFNIKKVKFSIRGRSPRKEIEKDKLNLLHEIYNNYLKENGIKGDKRSKAKKKDRTILQRKIQDLRKNIELINMLHEEHINDGHTYLTKLLA